MAASTELFGLGSWTWRSSQVIDREIDEELDFHIECRTRELIESGLDPVVAAEEAQRLFGGRDRIRRQCRQAVYGRGLWLMSSLGLGMVLSIAAIVWLTNQLALANQQNAAMHTRLAALQAAPDVKHDLVGEITDARGQPVANAKVLLIFKSWPGGKYKQQAFHQSSEKDGTFRFKELYSSAMQTAFLVTVLADGHAMQSEYVLFKPNAAVKTFQFRLQPALEKAFVARGADGQPLAQAVVWPATRKPDKSDEEFLIYDQSGVDAGYKTDAAGKVRMPLLALGDSVELRVTKEKMSETIRFVVDRAPEQTIGVSTTSGVQGTVTDASGKPVGNAKVLLIRKSWPEGKYQQEPFVTNTDAGGKYRFADANVEKDREALLVTVVKDGLAFQSSYVTKKAGETVGAFDFQLAPAVKKTILLRDAAGKPLADTAVAPSQRTAKSKDHLIYAMSATSVSFKTDSNGKVALNVFEAEDQAQLLILSPTGPQTVKFPVDSQPEQAVSVGKP
ncbi:MAG TPA: carboxypeptidase regulatory-like domain-containing protein [Planctomycetaceae bacterium]|nr:carboxypeptidase regulatory-like domain-containing protein [Planctomycetaceae bacterium]